MMQVSRPSLREALRVLSAMNIVEIRHGAGTYVTSLQAEELVGHLDFVYSLDDSSFLELIEARRIVEVGIIELAVQRITEPEIAGLEECLQKARRDLNDRHAFLQADLELHEKITLAARNHTLTRFMSSISQLGLASRLRTVELPGVPERALDDHQAIVSAIKAHDVEAAKQAMHRHLSRLEVSLKQMSAQPESQIESTFTT
jgi:DNA-binding FadR family transcriptional regulator